jgi:hypothetical protein
MMTTEKRRGRPTGLLINPLAATAFLGHRSQTWLATTAKVSTAHLSEMLAGTKGATFDVAERIAAALGVPAGALFPELVQFRTHIRHFVAPSLEGIA